MKCRPASHKTLPGTLLQRVPGNWLKLYDDLDVVTNLFEELTSDMVVLVTIHPERCWRAYGFIVSLGEPVQFGWVLLSAHFWEVDT